MITAKEFRETSNKAIITTIEIALRVLQKRELTHEEVSSLTLFVEDIAEMIRNFVDKAR